MTPSLVFDIHTNLLSRQHRVLHVVSIQRKIPSARYSRVCSISTGRGGLVKLHAMFVVELRRGSVLLERTRSGIIISLSNTKVRRSQGNAFAHCALAPICLAQSARLSMTGLLHQHFRRALELPATTTQHRKTSRLVPVPAFSGISWLNEREVITRRSKIMASAQRWRE